MIFRQLHQIWNRVWNSPVVRRRSGALGSRIGIDNGCELLEARQCLSAGSVAALVPKLLIVADAAPAASRRATHQSFDSPLGPVDLKLHNRGTRIHGTATIALTPGPTVPNVDLSPIRFRAQVNNLQLEGRFRGTFALKVPNAPQQRFVGTFTALPSFSQLGNLVGHVTIKVEGIIVADQDFDLPLANMLPTLP